MNNRIINTDNVYIALTTDSKALHTYSTNAVATQLLNVDNTKLGVDRALDMSDVNIKFYSEVPEFPGTEYKTTVLSEDIIGSGVAYNVNEWSISNIVHFPLDPANVVVDFKIPAVTGGFFVASTLADGKLVGDITEGSLNWDSGACSIKSDIAIKPDTNIEISIRYLLNPVKNCTFAVKGVEYKGQTEFIKVLNNFPIAPHTVRIKAPISNGTNLRVQDDGNGKLIGDIDITGENTVDYMTGVIKITFNKPVLDNLNIPIIYGKYQTVTKFPDIPKTEQFSVILRWVDLVRIVEAGKNLIKSEESTYKYIE